MKMYAIEIERVFDYQRMQIFACVKMIWFWGGCYDEYRKREKR